MALDDAFQADTDAALADLAQRPRPVARQTPSFSMWGLAKAAPRGAVAGVAQATGSGADILGAFGQVLGSLGQDDWLMPDPVKAAADTEKARKRLQEQGGPDYSSDVGRSFRNVGRDYMPDPVTAHSAEQAVAGLFRMGTKAVAAGALLGPIGGAVAAGAEEGFSTADDLREQGVDLATRTKVGGVSAVVNAASFALPVAGPTWKATAGLAVAGGPAAFIGQNAATREILQSANYGTIADQYDPFDPVGLALSTILPLGFGALAMRGAKSGRTAVPDVAGKVDDALPAGTASAADADVPALRPDPEAVDAARVNLLRENIDNTRMTPHDDLAGAAAHSGAVARAIDQLADGGRVDVADMVPATIASRIDAELAPRVARAMDEIAPALREMDPPPAVATAADVDVPLAAARADAAAPLATVADGADARPTTGDAPAAPKLVSESPEIDMATTRLEVDQPDLMVQLDDMDAPVSVGDLMKTVREQLSRELGESPLLEVAAACFVS